MRYNDLSKAEECFRETLAIQPDHLNGLIAFGTLMMIREKTKHAQTLFQEATTRCPSEGSAVAHFVLTAAGSPLAFAALGLYHEMEGNESQRRAAFKQLIAVEKDLAEKRTPYLRCATFMVTLHATQMVERALSEVVVVP